MRLANCMLIGLMLVGGLGVDAGAQPGMDSGKSSGPKSLTHRDDGDQTPSASYLLGTGIYDVTGPVAEVGMMGYSMLKQKSSGLHMRLRSRAYIIAEPNDGKRVVYVNADLLMISQAVKQRVSALVAANPELAPYYNEKNILLSANHTHSGPGGYSHYTIYDLSILGFVQDTFDVICNGIYQSIVNAHENLEPGNILINRGEVDECGWNRSPIAYMNNPEDERAKYDSDQDKTMTLLKLVAADGRELGMINWFAVHPTSLSNNNQLISGDNKGLAEYLFEKDKGTDYLAKNTFIAAFANTNCADISPNIFWGYPEGGESDFKKMEILARRQYDKAKELYDGASEAVVGSIDFRHHHVDFQGMPIDPAFAGDQTDKKVGFAAVGASMLAGSTEDGVGLKIFKEGMVWGEPGWPKITFIPAEQKWHAEKIIMLPIGRMKPYPWAPSILPVQILRIGSIALVAIPAEVTTMSGRRLRETVSRELSGVGVKDVIISSYSNAYTSYLTTREEYAKQHYEGGSTLYGPYTLNGYQQLFSEMARAMATGLEVADGPTPPDLTKALLHLKYGPPFDTVPSRKNFGDLIQDVAPQYKRGVDVASAIFWGGHPKHDGRTQGTFLEVQKLSGQDWVTVARDWDPETRYIWKKQGLSSKITLEWRIPAEAEPGEYRLVHHGSWKSSKTKEITPYTGVSGTFIVE